MEKAGRERRKSLPIKRSDQGGARKRSRLLDTKKIKSKRMVDRRPADLSSKAGDLAARNIAPGSEVLREAEVYHHIKDAILRDNVGKFQDIFESHAKSAADLKVFLNALNIQDENGNTPFHNVSPKSEIWWLFPDMASLCEELQMSKDIYVLLKIKNDDGCCLLDVLANLEICSEVFKKISIHGESLEYFQLLSDLLKTQRKDGKTVFGVMASEMKLNELILKLSTIYFHSGACRQFVDLLTTEGLLSPESECALLDVLENTRFLRNLIVTIQEHSEIDNEDATYATLKIIEKRDPHSSTIAQLIFEKSISRGDDYDRKLVEIVIKEAKKSNEIANLLVNVLSGESDGIPFLYHLNINEILFCELINLYRSTRRLNDLHRILQNKRHSFIQFMISNFNTLGDQSKEIFPVIFKTYMESENAELIFEILNAKNKEGKTVIRKALEDDNTYFFKTLIESFKESGRMDLFHKLLEPSEDGRSIILDAIDKSKTLADFMSEEFNKQEWEYLKSNLSKESDSNLIHYIIATSYPEEEFIQRIEELQGGDRHYKWAMMKAYHCSKVEKNYERAFKFILDLQEDDPGLDHMATFLKLIDLTKFQDENDWIKLNDFIITKRDWFDPNYFTGDVASVYSSIVFQAHLIRATTNQINSPNRRHYLNFNKILYDKDRSKWDVLRRDKQVGHGTWISCRIAAEGLANKFCPGRSSDVLSFIEKAMQSKDAQSEVGQKDLKSRIVSVFDYLQEIYYKEALVEEQKEKLFERIKSILKLMIDGASECPDRTVVLLDRIEDNIKLFENEAYAMNILVQKFKKTIIESELSPYAGGESVEALLYYLIVFNRFFDLGLPTKQMLNEEFLKRTIGVIPNDIAIKKIFSKLDEENLVGFIAGQKVFMDMYDEEFMGFFESAQLKFEDVIEGIKLNRDKEMYGKLLDLIKSVDVELIQKLAVRSDEDIAVLYRKIKSFKNDRFMTVEESRKLAIRNGLTEQQAEEWIEVLRADQEGISLKEFKGIVNQYDLDLKGLADPKMLDAVLRLKVSDDFREIKALKEEFPNLMDAEQVFDRIRMNQDKEKEWVLKLENGITVSFFTEDYAEASLKLRDSLAKPFFERKATSALVDSGFLMDRETFFSRASEEKEREVKEQEEEKKE